MSSLLDLSMAVPGTREEPRKRGREVLVADPDVVDCRSWLSVRALLEADGGAVAGMSGERH